MSEVIYRSPGVFTTEIDLSQPAIGQPIGVPAGVIGTSNRGPAFVPLTVADYAGFAATFGGCDGEKFGPLAVNEFLKNAQALTYMRVLGCGDGKQRDATSGKVTNAGFVVGNQQVQDNGVVGANKKASSQQNDKGRTFFLGCLMSESNGSTYFSSAGIQEGKADGKKNHAVPVLRGVILCPSSVIATLSRNFYDGRSAQPEPDTVYNTSEASSNIQGGITGSVNMANYKFTMLLNGHKATDEYPNVLTGSFDIQSGYFADIFNTDATKLRDAGHYLY